MVRCGTLQDLHALGRMGWGPGPKRSEGRRQAGFLVCARKAGGQGKNLPAGVAAKAEGKACPHGHCQPFATQAVEKRKQRTIHWPHTFRQSRRLIAEARVSFRPHVILRHGSSQAHRPAPVFVAGPARVVRHRPAGEAELELRKPCCAGRRVPLLHVAVPGRGDAHLVGLVHQLARNAGEIACPL